MTARGKYTIDDLQSDTSHLQHLIEVIADRIIECDFGTKKDRNVDLDKVEALVWIARDLSQHLSKKFEKHYREIGSSVSGRSA